MSLKQSVVIVSNFTNNRTAGSGSQNRKYGATPGNFVLRYMAREGATEDLTPVRYDAENFIMRYMAREDAVESALSVPDLKDNMRNIQGDGGIAFGYGDFSLSHKKLAEASKDIQKCYDEGKTVMKTVISFDEEYLRKNHIIDDDFHAEQEGDYRGNIDQMKLRLAIMNGLDKMGDRYFDDLHYVGVIQVDTKHVHAHVAMVDKGTGTFAADGTQRGKLTAAEKKVLRRGIDMYLDESQSVKMMAANVAYDRRNTLCFIKKYTHKVMDNRGFTQFLLACLPEDRSKWSARSNSKEMRKANMIVREYVDEVLAQPDSGYDEALRKIDTYARSRQKNEGLTGQEYRELYRVGQERIITEGMNSVYSILKRIPQNEFEVRTPLMEVMALPYDEMASEADTDEMIEFGFKLRSYKTRLDHHKKEMHKYHDAATEYREQRERGRADESSAPLLRFFEEEEEYNAMLMSKYQYFVKFIPPEDEYKDGLDEVLDYDKRVRNLEKMRADENMYRMKEDNAEDYGRRVYESSGGRYMVTSPQILDERLARMRQSLDDMVSQYRYKLSDYGMDYKDGKVVNETQYDFDKVKALDLHHLMYDFPYDFEISKQNVEAFLAQADKRGKAFDEAKAYLVASGQSDLVATLPEGDIDTQRQVAEKMKSDAVMHTRREATEEQRKATRTIALDSLYYDGEEEDIKTMIKETVASIQYEL